MGVLVQWDWPTAPTLDGTADATPTERLAAAPYIGPAAYRPVNWPLALCVLVCVAFWLAVGAWAWGAL